MEILYHQLKFGQGDVHQIRNRPYQRVWLSRSIARVAAWFVLSLALASLAFGQGAPEIVWQADSASKAIVFFPDGQMLLSGNQVRQASDGTVIRTFTLPRIGQGINTVAILPDAQFAAIGVQSFNQNLDLFRVADGTLIAGPISAHDNGTESVAFSPDGQPLASAGMQMNTILRHAKLAASSPCLRLAQALADMSIRTGTIYVVLLGVACLSFSVLSAVTQNFLFVTLAAFTFFSLLVVFPVALIVGFVVWRKRSRLWLVPPSIFCVLFALIPLAVGRIAVRISDWRFKMHIGDYERVVAAIKQQRDPQGRQFVEIDLDKVGRPPGVVAVQAARCPDGALLVEFLVSAGGRIHRGYVFNECDDTSSVYGPKGIQGRYELKPISARWYKFAD